MTSVYSSSSIVDVTVGIEDDINLSTGSINYDQMDDS
jgi:hypothetical protein